MTVLLTGLILFFSVHSVSIIHPSCRDRVAARIGEWSWKGIYSVVAIVGLVFIVWGYGLARQEPVIVYVPPPWLRHVTLLLMIFVFPLLLAAYLPGRIKAATQHPMLAATKIWAFAHLLANGMLADILLFGSFLIWAVADRISMKHREQRWIPQAPPSRANDALAIGLGLGLYVAFVFWLHLWLFGVSPLA
jgi:uncharacterized membrane protein